MCKSVSVCAEKYNNNNNNNNNNIVSCKVHRIQQ